MKKPENVKKCLQGLSDAEIQGLWNKIGSILEGKEPPINGPGIGLFQLSRETKRRGLVLAPGRYNKDIVLIKK